MSVLATRWPARWHASLCALLGALLLGLSSARTSHAAEASEYELKAAFLANFVKYVKWPPRAFDADEAPLIVAVLGTDPFGKTLDDTLRDKTAGTRKIEVRRFKTLADVTTCHLVFVPAGETTKVAKIVEALAKRPVLLIGESTSFAAAGGVIGFYLEQKKVRFEINLDAAKRAELDISSQLLKLARVVKDEAGGR